MVKKIKARWVKALRSGKYKQGTGALQDKVGHYCCLGVLQDLYCKSIGTTMNLKKKSYLTRDAAKWAGLVKKSGAAITKPEAAWKGEVHELADLNDEHRLSFKQIATIIAREKTL